MLLCASRWARPSYVASSPAERITPLGKSRFRNVLPFVSWLGGHVSGLYYFCDPLPLIIWGEVITQTPFL